MCSLPAYLSLHLMSYPFTKALFRYSRYFAAISRSIASGQFRLGSSYCPYCDQVTRFICLSSSPIDVRCSKCGSTAVSLSSIKSIAELNLSDANTACYEMSYHGAVFNYLTSHFSSITSSEYFGPEDLGKVHNGVRNEDVQNLTFEDQSFDLVTSTEVFEHIPQYYLGFREVFRVLKRGGRFVFTIPLYDNEKTQQCAYLSDDMSLKWLTAPEYHDIRVTGPCSVPVFWRHSRHQIVDDLVSIGFSEALVKCHQIGPTNVDSFVVVATK